LFEELTFSLSTPAEDLLWLMPPNCDDLTKVSRCYRFHSVRRVSSVKETPLDGKQAKQRYGARRRRKRQNLLIRKREEERSSAISTGEQPGALLGRGKLLLERRVPRGMSVTAWWKFLGM
jgi:hypothetical protein